MCLLRDYNLSSSISHFAFLHLCWLAHFQVACLSIHISSHYLIFLYVFFLFFYTFSSFETPPFFLPVRFLSSTSDSTPSQINQATFVLWPFFHQTFLKMSIISDVQSLVYRRRATWPNDNNPKLSLPQFKEHFFYLRK